MKKQKYLSNKPNIFIVSPEDVINENNVFKTHDNSSIKSKSKTFRIRLTKEEINNTYNKIYNKVSENV